MMDSEHDRAAMGAYRPDVANPDYCNPFAVALWETSTLRHHYHPAVSEQVRVWGVSDNKVMDRLDVWMDGCSV